VKRWVKGKAAETQNHFLRDLDRLLKATGKDPDQFLAFAESSKPVDVQDLIDKVAESLKPGAKINLIANLRSFLHHNGFNNLPKANLTYILQEWHRAYKKEEIQKLLSYLDSPFHKLYVYMAVESGLRAQTVIDIKYGHIKQDLEANLPELAVRFKPEAYSRKKAAGFTFLGKRSVELIRKLTEDGKIKTTQDSPLIPISYTAVYLALNLARKKADLPREIQPNHGLRKFFQNALDKADIDHDQKMVMEGHYQGIRAKSYTDREFENLRPLYKRAYPFIDPEQGNVEMAVKVQSQEEEVKDLKKELADVRGELTAIRKWMESQGKRK